jgi:hypothetical protein
MKSGDDEMKDAVKTVALAVDSCGCQRLTVKVRTL